MERPLPTRQLILAMTGSNQYLVSAAHHGLYETPLNELYTNLNLDEVIAFAAASWQLRYKNLEDFAAVVKSRDIYFIFSMLNQIGFPWLNANKRISEGQKDLYEGLNPYKGRTLEARLERADPEAMQTLKEMLQRHVDSYPLMKPHELAVEIAEMISRYPREYEPLTVVKSPTPKHQIPLPL